MDRNAWKRFHNSSKFQHASQVVCITESVGVRSIAQGLFYKLDFIRSKRAYTFLRESLAPTCDLLKQIRRCHANFAKKSGNSRNSWLKKLFPKKSIVSHAFSCCLSGCTFKNHRCKRSTLLVVRSKPFSLFHQIYAPNSTYQRICLGSLK